jgi:hypothetical protein
MDPAFNRGFEEQINRLLQIAPYDAIMGMIRSVKTELPIRVDGILFLLVNTSRMIVIPWDITRTNATLGSPTMGQDFLFHHGKDLSEDLRELITEADAAARAQGQNEISANILTTVTGNRTVGVRTRGTNIWGP